MNRFACLCTAGLALTARIASADTAEAPAEVKPLPKPALTGGASLVEALAKRRSVRDFVDAPLTEQQIAQLLWAAQGVTEPRRGFRTAPSAGATYPLVTYAVTAQGVFRYEPATHAVRHIKAGDVRPALEEAALGQPWVSEAPLNILFTSIDSRTTRRYGRRGIMYIHMEAGHAAQNIQLQAVALGLGSVPIGAFRDADLIKALGVPADQRPLYLICVGRPAADQ